MSKKYQITIIGLLLCIIGILLSISPLIADLTIFGSWLVGIGICTTLYGIFNRNDREEDSFWKTFWNCFWKVPLFCIIADYASAFVYNILMDILIPPFAKSEASATLLTQLSLAILFIAVFTIGYFVLFRKMTRREIFISTTIDSLFLIVRLLLNTIGRSWVAIIPTALVYIIPAIDNLFTYIVFSCITPYLFVLLGKKHNK